MAKKPLSKNSRPAGKKKSLPVLADDADLYALFGAENTDEKTKFAEFIQTGLDAKEISSGLAEKTKFAADLSKNRGNQLKSYPPPQSELDLHGNTAGEAENKSENFVRWAATKGLRTILIITGKGLHSENESVLKPVVEAKMMEMKEKNMVFSWRWEKKHRQKSGALLVYLNREAAHKCKK